MSEIKATYKEIISIALPLIIGNMAWAFIGLTDQAFMGHYGRVEEAAIGPVSIFYSILFMIGFGYSRGIQILMAKAYGANNNKRVGFLFDNAAFVMIVVSLIVMIALFLYKDFLLRILLADEQIILAANEYLEYRIIGIPASFLSTVFVGFYSGIGKTRLLSVSVLTMAIINIILNYLLVFGEYGFPKLGIGGAGIASSIAEWISLGILSSGLILRGYLKKFDILKLNINFSEIISMSKTSTPLVMQSILGNLGWFVFFTLVEKLGQKELASSNILRQLMMWIGIPIWALGSVTNTVVGNLIGQKAEHQIKNAIKKILKVSLSITVIQSSILLLFYTIIIGIFSADTTMAVFSYRATWVIIIATFIMSISNTLFNALVTSCGTRFALYFELLALAAYMLYIYILFSLDSLTVAQAWTTEWIYWSVILVASYLKLKQQKII